MTSIRRILAALLLPGLAAAAPAVAAPAPFDLMGPQLRVTVTRAGKTLPIAQAPNLAVGDRLSIRADLPRTQSAHYLLVAGFLQGVTNPPPEKWFAQSRTWDPKDKAGLSLTVPDGAQQLLVFLAPQTGGDFKTLVNAVRARPGAFVRASQDLNQASLDHERLETFLEAVQAINQSDPSRLKAASPLLARSLTIKLDSACLDKTADMQASCLTQGQDSLVLNDGHSTSMVGALSSGYSADLIQALSATPQAGGGYFSPYVASVLDIAHIMDSFHTAQYQYIPALAVQDRETLSLLLNAPPSFQNPKSVLVAALPAVEPAQAPPLHAVDPEAAACLQKPGFVLPVEGAPLVFSTAYAHDLVLHVKAKGGAAVDLPVRADAEKGGFVLDAAGPDIGAFDPLTEGQVVGSWGFEPYAGPKFRLHSGGPQAWRLADGDQQALTAGQVSTVRLQAQASACVDSVMLQPASGPARAVDWKAAGPDALTVTASLKDIPPGSATLLIKAYGAKAADAVPVTVYAAASKLEGFVLHAGDASGVLRGAGLEEVASLELSGVVFRPDPAIEANGGLGLTAADPAAAGRLKAGQDGRARVRLKDGRTVSLAAAVAPPRPVVSLIGKSLQPAASEARITVALKDPDELPHDATLTFSIHAQAGTAFTGAETIEAATAQGGFSTRLTAAGGGFVLQNGEVALATLDLNKAFGASAFGLLRFRLVNADGATDWLPLGALVRVPALQELNCPAAKDQPCQLSGSGLFLIDSVSRAADFADPVQVPSGFPGNTLQVPRPRDGQLYVKLSDNPTVTNAIVLPGEGAQREASRPFLKAAQP